jgi:hypothetical protein
MTELTAATRALISAAKIASRRAALRFVSRELGNPGRPDAVAADLRRRREAALRLPPLPNGRHDPMEPKAR